MPNTFGHLFRITTWGESHGGGVGVVLDGCPPPTGVGRIRHPAGSRPPPARPVQDRHPRDEADRVSILSGTFEGKTLGTPILMMVHNKDHRPEAYSEMKTKFRPSHADFTYQQKFGFRNWQGGGRSSARETIGRVAAGAVAKKLLKQRFGVEVLSYVKQVRKIVADVNPDKVKLRDIESNIVRCPDPAVADKMIRLIDRTRKAGDTVGGIIEGVARGLPVGWGDPVFDRLEADLAKAMLSLPPRQKVLRSAPDLPRPLLNGTEHNDPIRANRGNVQTTKNDSGGVQGGISNGETVHFRVAFKPVATVMHEQDTIDDNLKNTTLRGRGRHDPCVLPEPCRWSRP